MASYSGFKDFAFISYSHKNSSKVQEILGKLSSRGVRYWFDENLTPSDEYIEVIGEKVEKSSFFIAFLSKDSLASRYCRDEIRFAYENEKDMMIIYLEPCELTAGYKMMLNGVQAFNAYNQVDNSMYDNIISGIPQSIIEVLGEKIYETDNYIYYFTPKSHGNGYCIIRKSKMDSTTEKIINESFPPASEYRIYYVTRHRTYCNSFEICIGVTWDFTYTGYREDEYYDECYLYTILNINSKNANFAKKVLWRHDLVTDEHIDYDTAPGIYTITQGDGKKIIKGNIPQGYTVEIN